MSPFPSDRLPPLDLHAHIDPSLTNEQLRGLGSAVIFAMTRTLAEASLVNHRLSDRIIWACGVHPAAREDFDIHRLVALLPHFAIVGEIGMDRRAGQLIKQAEILSSILHATAHVGVLASVHSTGCSDEVVALVEDSGHQGVILHWFTGNDESVERAAEAGCYFSVNAAMTDEALSRIPRDRILPETDYPSTSRRGGGTRPGDTAALESRLSSLVRSTPSEVRVQWYRNLRALAIQSGSIDRLPEPLADALVAM